MKAFALATLSAFAAQGTAAQDVRWIYSATIYSWLPGMTT
jgi:hypothetical protein